MTPTDDAADEEERQRSNNGTSAGSGGLFKLFALLILLATAALLLFGTTSLPDDAVPAPGSFLRRRMQDRFQMLSERLREATTRRRRLRDERDRREVARAAHEKQERQQRRLDERVEWNATSREWEQVAANQTVPHANATATPKGRTEPAGTPAGSPPPPRPRLRRVPVTISLPSPPAPLGPPVLLRFGLEAACLHYQEPLELLARAA